jgi:2-oxoisovalerate dehydrogenase E1 component
MPKDIDVLPDFTTGQIEILPIPRYLYDRTLADEIEAGLTHDEARSLLRHMMIIRTFEERVAEMKSGRYTALPGFKFVGASHLSIGQEAVAAGTMAGIRADDYITSTHRGHGHSIAKSAFAIESMTAEELAEFIGVPPTDAPWEALFQQACQMHLHRTMAELLGKEEGYCRGRGGGMHIADFHTGHLGANAIVGGSLAIATGAAMACSKLGNDRVVVCIVGDGGMSNGIAGESLNFASMAQFKRGTPVIYLVENNQYAMTGQEVGEVTGVRYLAQRAAGYDDENMNAEVVNGMDILAVRDAVGRAAEKCRGGEGPVLLECMTYRYMGHSLSDSGETYRSPEEEAAWRREDCIERYSERLVAAGVMNETEVEQLDGATRAAIDEATLSAYHSADPNPEDIYAGLYASTTSDDIDDEWRTPEDAILQPWRAVRRDSQGRMLYRHAVTEALVEEMTRDRRVILYGEDVADYGGAFQATRGLLATFGRERVFNTAISESAIVGTAVGAAMVGLRPVAEIMYIDFLLMTMDQTGNQAAKARYMFGGKATVPMVIRTTIGGGKGYAGQHSQSLEAIPAHIPGLRIAMPSTPYDAKGLLKTAIRDDNPVIFIEHQNLYDLRGEVPEEDYTVPFGEAVVRREGDDLTLVAYSSMAPIALEVAERAAEELKVGVEVVDPRTLCPLDVDTIAESVRKTGRLLLITQAPGTGCFSEHIAYAVQEQCFADMKAPACIVAAYDVPPPMAQPLELKNIPSPERILEAIKGLVS